MKSIWKSVRGWLPGVIISLIAIALIPIVLKVNLRSLAQAIRTANYWILLFALAISWTWLAVRGLVWRTLLRNKASYKQVFFTLCEGYLLNNFLPLRLGELGRAYLLGRKAGLPFMEVLSSIVIERVMDVAFTVMVLLIAVPFIVGSTAAFQVALVVGVLVVVGALVLYLLARNREWALGWFDRLTARWPKLQEQGGRFLAPLFSGLAVLTEGWLFLRALLWMTLNWIFGVVQFYLMVLAFLPHATLAWAMFGLGAAAFAGAVPSLPGGIGTYDAALAGALTLVSHAGAASLAVALVAHLLNYVLTGLFGAYAFSTEGETLMGIYRQLRRRQAEPQNG
jgi:uncharacterized protein (TIRG00374 family)